MHFRNSGFDVVSKMLEYPSLVHDVGADTIGLGTGNPKHDTNAQRVSRFESLHMRYTDPMQHLS